MDDAKPVRDTIARYRSEAYRKGAADMRERAAKLVEDEADCNRDARWLSINIRALPTEKPPPAGEG